MARFDLADFAEIDPELLAYHQMPFTLHRCEACGFMQPEGLPTLPNFFDRLYAPYHSMQLQTEEGGTVNTEIMMAHDFEGGSKDLIFRRVLRGVRRGQPTQGLRLLDVGSHVGRLLWLAKQENWVAEGIEVNPTTAEYARRRTGAMITDVPISKLTTQIKPGLHAITIVDVLEHIPEPLPLLKQLFSLLAPGGTIAVKVPCGSGQLLKEWLKSRLRPSYEFTIARNMYHVNHFSHRSLRIALEHAGFAEVSFVASPPEVFRPGSLHGAIRTLPSNMARTLHYWFCRIPGARRIGPFNLHLLAFARRPE